MSIPPPVITRRTLTLATVATAVADRAASAQPGSAVAEVPAPAKPGVKMAVQLSVNGQAHALDVDPRTTLLDALRDHIGLAGTKKGCDHGQSGACTVLIDGVRMNSCLSLAVARDGQQIVTVEGLAQDGKLHPMQAAFVTHDGFQCGYCTPGQICSAVGALSEIERGVPSAVSDLASAPQVSGMEIRERMSGNICRCSAYPNIVAAILDAKGRA